MSALPALILVVEDDAELRAVVVESLALEGYDVAEAPDGLVALDVARERHPALILLDLMMPRMSGWDFRHEQRADPALADIPVVVMSAAIPSDVARLDARAYLHKPFDFDDMLEEVATLTHSSAHRRRAPFAARDAY